MSEQAFKHSLEQYARNELATLHGVHNPSQIALEAMMNTLMQMPCIQMVMAQVNQ